MVAKFSPHRIHGRVYYRQSRVRTVLYYVDVLIQALPERKLFHTHYTESRSLLYGCSCVCVKDLFTMFTINAFCPISTFPPGLIVLFSMSCFIWRAVLSETTAVRTELPDLRAAPSQCSISWQRPQLFTTELMVEQLSTAAM